ncbi:MAG: mannose-6-phosphate isomerase, class I [Acidipropionibacterium acidipropionici]|nr:mannose-6-phosphate isomerase, class I [Acidipropionibacterium acidipropionici]
MERLSGSIRNYAWGSMDAIPRILGREPDGLPQAEYWLGSYESAPSSAAEQSLLDRLGAHPEELGDANREHFGDRLPFLLKILSAAKPLSLQAHPDRKAAGEGHARSLAAGVEADQRTFVDEWPRPELMVALSEVEALCGFRDPLHTRKLFDALGTRTSLDPVLGPLTERSGSAAMAEVFLDTLTVDAKRRAMAREVVSAAVNHVGEDSDLGEFCRTAVELDEHRPDDSTILAALLLNRVHLSPGQALRVPPGTLHTYLSGTGVEISANSNNIVRGGLTDKLIDVDALISIVNFNSCGAGVVEPVGDGVIDEYPTDFPECRLWALHLRPGHAPILPATDSPRILLVIGGHAVCSSSAGTEETVGGHALWIPAGEQVQVQGNCDGFLAGVGTPQE